MKLKKIYLATLMAAGIGGVAHADDIMVETFMTDGQGSRYTASTPFNDGVNDHWNRTDGTDISNVSGAYSGFSDTHFWAAEDTDDTGTNGGNGNDEQTLDISGIDISNYTNLRISGLFGSGNTSGIGGAPDGGADALDYMIVQYRVDSADPMDFVDALCFRYEDNGDAFNEPLGLDADCSGTSDTPGMNQLTTTLQEFGQDLTGVVGNTMDIRVLVFMDGAKEEVAFDDLKLTGDLLGVDNPPQVISTTPADMATGVAIDSNVLINFDKAVDVAINAVNIDCAVSGMQNFPLAAAAGVNSLDIDAADFTPGELCTVTAVAASITDVDGNADPLDGDGNGAGGDDYVFSFTVNSDVAPTVSSTVPADAAVDVAADSNITINFDEAIDATVNAVTLTCDAMLQTFSGLPFAGTSMVLNPNVDLPFDASCSVNVVAAEVSDQDGTIDNMAADFSFGFTVESAPVVINLIVNEYQADPDAQNGDANGDGVADTSQDEFVEIYNDSTDPLDISGWTLADGAAVRHTFAPGTVLGGCKAIVVFGGGTPTGSFGGSEVVVASGGFLGLNNGGDSIIINDGVTDQVNLIYGSSGTNQSYTLDPDITGSGFVEHSGANGSSGALFSPGTRINGGVFIPCDGTPLPPRVDSNTPSNGAGGVDLTTNIEINFSENVDATINAATLTCDSNVISFTGLPVMNGNQLIIDPSTDLPNGATCTVELIAAEITDLDDVADQLDGNGDLIAGDNYSFSFIAGYPDLEIFEIQGSGLSTAYSGIEVQTNDNIVTAVGTNGFYMQTPDSRDDADPATSNGIFVFTGGAPTVSVGDQIDLRGEITEFFELTEFANPGSYVLSLDSSGNALPTAVILDGSFPSPDPTMSPCGDPALGYECFEGMYFEMPQGFVSAASVGFFGRDRDDVWVRAGSDRARREPGIEFPGMPGLPVFDGNPELIEMSVEALGLPLQQLSAGSEIALEGVISFGFGDYELQPTVLTMINENSLPGAARDAVGDEVTVASANLFRLFNDVDDPGSEDDDQIADPAEYADRLAKIANYIVNDMKSPTIIGLQEVENNSVLQDLSVAIANAGGPTYVAIIVPGNDQGGINVAYLHQAGMLSNITVTQLGAAELNPFDNSLLHDRPPLRLEADVTISSGTLPLNLLVVHLRSRSSIDDAVEGDRVRNKRLSQANSVAAMVDDILTEDPDKSLYVIGDFNAFEFTDGYVDVVGQITGEAVQADNLLWSAPLFAASPLAQAVQTLPAEQQYSFVFGGSAQVLDNAIMNDEGLMNLVDMQYVRGQADASVQFEADAMTSLRSTDHDGFVLYILNDDDLIFKNGFE